MAITITRRDALRRALTLSIGSALPMQQASAQSWPARNLTIIVGGVAGSVPDSLARLAADALSKKVGQSIVIENRPGAGGIAAIRSVIESKPDGYTIGLATISQTVFNSYLFDKLPYDPQHDVAPISTLAGSSFVLAAHPSLGETILADVVAQSKKEPGKLLIGVPANGSPPHVAAILLMRQTGLSATFVHFKSGPDALTAAMRNDVQLIVDGPTLIAPQVESGVLKAVVVTSHNRQDVLKEVPTIAEAGFASAEFESWLGLVAPRGTPEEVISRLSRESRAILDDDDYAKKLHELSFVPKSATPQEFTSLISREHQRWSGVLRGAGFKLQ